MKKIIIALGLFALTACSGGTTTAQIPSIMSPSGMANQEAANKNN